MGNQSSASRFYDLKNKYVQHPGKKHPFFGHHSLLISKKDSQSAIICKNLMFLSHHQYDQFMNLYTKIKRKPFSLAFPKDIIDIEASQQCASIQQVKVCFQIAGKPLHQIVASEGLFSETKAWFLLNEISKSLEVLDEMGRAHWALSPSTVYRNQNNNYLLYDSFFVLGFDPTNFLNQMRFSGGPLLQKVKTILDHGAVPGREEGNEQDMYMLGMTLFFVLTGVSLDSLPPQPKKQHFLNKILDSEELRISRQMRSIIHNLIQPTTLRRLDNLQLRRLLKDQESDIIKKQGFQLASSNADSHFQPHLYHQYRLRALQLRREKDSQYEDSNSNHQLFRSHHFTPQEYIPSRPKFQEPTGQSYGVRNQQFQQEPFSSLASSFLVQRVGFPPPKMGLVQPGGWRLSKVSSAGHLRQG